MTVNYISSKVTCKRVLELNFELNETMNVAWISLEELNTNRGGHLFNRNVCTDREHRSVFRKAVVPTMTKL